MQTTVTAACTDSGDGFIYVFSEGDLTNTHSIVSQINLALTSQVTADIGPAANQFILTGDFDNAYFTGGPLSGQGTLYACGTDAGAGTKPSLYALSFSAPNGLMNTTPAMSDNRNINGASNLAGSCSPLLDFYDGITDRLFVGAIAIVLDVQKGVCLYCQKPLSKQSQVDHFVPWSRYPADLGSVLVYKLDPAHGPLANPPASAPQPLSPQAAPVDRTKLSKLLRVDFVAAQRGLGMEEAETRSTAGAHRVGLFSNQLLKYARQHLNVATTGQGHQPELVAAIATAQLDLDARIKAALTPSIEDVKKLGYPTLHDPQEIHFRTRIQTGDLLDHSTAVQYRLDGKQEDVYLPEYSIGLGYQNLQS